MRHINKNSQAPRALRLNAQYKTQELIDIVDAGNDSPVIDELYKHNDVKQQLLKDQNKKCAYCERKLNGDFGAVEHFRPKKGWKQNINNALSKPGYYWLAYDWDNLLYSCSECNTNYKKNLFPLDDPRTRDIPHRNISREIPLIINPSKEDPSQYLAFRKEIVVPRIINGFPSAKGVKTIELLGLNSRLDLKQARRKAYSYYKFFCLIKKILARDKYKVLVPLIDRYISSCTNEYAEFTGMFENQL